MYCVTLTTEGARGRAWHDRIAGTVAADAELARHTTYRVGGPAKYLVIPAGPDDVREVFGSGERVFVMGAGSNILASDRGFDGIVLKIAHQMSYLSIEEDEVIVGAGRPLPSLVRSCADAGLGGLEWAVSIPGTVGGAVCTNAGAYGAAMWDCVRYVDLVTAAGELRRFGRDDVERGYRRVRFDVRKPFAVTEVGLGLTAAPQTAIEALVESFKARRQDNQPVGAASAGCVFKNPPQGPGAGELIDKTGLKGLRRGGAIVSYLHANFIVNEGGATAADIYGLITDVRARVKEKHNVDLELELELVGEFGDA